jgi:membrane-associated phospholipid phosphatase
MDRKVDLKVIEGKGPKAHEPGDRPAWARRPGEPEPGDGPGLRPVDVLLVGYLLLTSVLLLAFPHHVPAWPLLLSLRLVVIVLILRAAAARPKHRLLRWARDWYPIAMFIPLYAELSVLTNLFTHMRYDTLVAGWEQGLFGGQPSQTLRVMFPARPISEYVHFSYFYYYFVPTTLALGLYLRGPRARFSVALTSTLLAFLSCCLIYILFPVVGPYHHFGHPLATSWPGIFGPLTHTIIEKGSSLGTAFPSSHTAVAVCVWLTAWRLSRPAFWLLALIVPALALGTVYGGFHYAVDTLAGALLGAGAALVGPSLHARLVARIAGKPAPERLQTFASQGRGRHLE